MGVLFDWKGGMVRADRLLSLMLMLQAHGRMTAQELAERLHVSERTIYRDIDALSMAGVPVYTQAGINGGCFLDEHYRISLTGLSQAQIRALIVSAGNAGPLQDLGLEQAVEETLLKLLAALPPVHRSEAERMRQRIFVDPVGWFLSDESPPCLPAVQNAVWEACVIEIVYTKRMADPVTRIVHPLGLVCKAGVWYLAGAYPGGDLRTFRIDRIQTVKTLPDDPFVRPVGFDLKAYWEASQARFRAEAPRYQVTLRVNTYALKLMEGYMAGRHQIIEDTQPDDWVLVEVVFSSLYEARMVVLGFGDQAQVVSPDELRDAVVDQASRVLAAYVGNTEQVPGD